MTYPDVGTLEEIGAKVGDVVRSIGETESAEVKLKDGMPRLWYDGLAGGIWGASVRNARETYRMIKRASDTPKTWGDMTDAEKGALLLAHHKGRDIEDFACERWTKCFVPSWKKWCAYRVKPEPKRETVTRMIFYDGLNAYSAMVQFDVIDGVPQWDTLRKAGD